jgi:hypothetical protein
LAVAGERGLERPLEGTEQVAHAAQPRQADRGLATQDLAAGFGGPM